MTAKASSVAIRPGEIARVRSGVVAPRLRTATGMDVREPRDPKMVRGFRQRGHETVSRIESFSDAVFGFSVTLLVVSLQVPRSFDDLLRTLAGFPAFALTFALLAQIWYIQYRFFRRYALQDGTTVFLNLVLLFVVVFFTYPLKFLFGFASGTTIRFDQIVPLYATYALGYGAIFGTFALMYAHAYAVRDALALTETERRATRHSVVLSLYQVVVAAVSVGASAAFVAAGNPHGALAAGGIAYVLVPIGIRALKVAERRRPADDGAIGDVSA